MRFETKWRYVVAFALGLPTTIFSVSLFLHVAVDKGIISKNVGNIILIAFLAQCVGMLVWYGTRKKN